MDRSGIHPELVRRVSCPARGAAAEENVMDVNLLMIVLILVSVAIIALTARF
jgi:hypothetical protein